MIITKESFFIDNSIIYKDIYRIFQFFLKIRLLIFSIGLFVYFFLNPYDRSSLILSKVHPNYSKIFRIFSKWDALYFLEISENGYTYELFHAFFPGYPLLIRFISNIFSIFPFFIDPISISALFVSNVAFMISVYFLYRWLYLLFVIKPFMNNKFNLMKGSLEKFNKKASATVRFVTMLYCMNPASIFFTAPYDRHITINFFYCIPFIYIYLYIYIYI